MKYYTAGNSCCNENGGTTDIGAAISDAANAVPNNTDFVATAEGSVLKKITWTNVKAFLKTYFDTIYTTTGAVATQITNALSGYLTSATAATTYAPINSPTFTGTVSGITKSMVGLSNVDNTSDVNKPVSTLQQTALNLKANIASPTFTGTVVLPSGQVVNGVTLSSSGSATLYLTQAGTYVSIPDSTLYKTDFNNNFLLMGA